jgi:hypothetical protein
MRRREWMLLLGGLISAPHTLRAQQKAMAVIGYLASSTPATNAQLLPAFFQGLSARPGISRDRT